ncbi:MAG: hypothetical protein NTV19_20825 [Burkholderiales bacterium]|nr:hypothetical protein [Burkholderiales bacterium]
MTSPVAEAALAAITARLAAALPSVVVERARRAPVDIESETLPRLVLHIDSLDADASAEPGATHYRIGLTVVGTAIGTSDLEAQQAVISLHASVVAVLVGWTPNTAGLGDVVELGADFLLHDVDQSATPAGEFAARFEMLAVAATGSPYI